MDEDFQSDDRALARRLARSRPSWFRLSLLCPLFDGIAETGYCSFDSVIVVDSAAEVSVALHK
eukprot:5935582-Pyramimonas_sp.AAC.2